MKIRKCRCCGEEYDIDNCHCKGWCERCKRCDLHCAGHPFGVDVHACGESGCIVPHPAARKMFPECV